MNDFDYESLQTQNPVIEQLYSSNRNIFELTAALCALVELDESPFDGEALDELCLVPFIDPTSLLNAVQYQHAPPAEAPASELPAYWPYFFNTAIAFLAMQIGHPLLDSSAGELPVTRDMFLGQVKDWLGARERCVVLLNPGAEGLEELLDEFTNQQVGQLLRNRTDDQEIEQEEYDLLYDNERLSVEQSWGSISQRVIPVTLEHVSSNAQMGQVFALLQFYPVSIAHIWVNDQYRTNATPTLLALLMMAARTGVLAVSLSDVSDTHNPNLGALLQGIGYSSFQGLSLHQSIDEMLTTVFPSEQEDDADSDAD